MALLEKGLKAAPKNICILPGLKNSYFSIRILKKNFTLKLQLLSD